jgi:hypothetical protein
MMAILAKIIKKEVRRNKKKLCRNLRHSQILDLRRKIMKRFYLVFIVLLTVLLTAVAVYAAPPDVTVTEISDTGETFEECGEFNILIDTVGTKTIKLFYNNDGQLVKELYHVSGTDYIYREGYPQNGFGGNFGDNRLTNFDPDTGDVIDGHYAGNAWNIILPGAGPVFKISGSAYFEGDLENLLTDVGRFVYDGEAICAYFAS